MRLDGLGHYFTVIDGHSVNILIAQNSPAWDHHYITPILEDVAHPTKYTLSVSGKKIGYFDQLAEAYNEAKFLIATDQLNREG